MKIGLIGPHGAGKTTLLNQFKEKYPWAIEITSASRDVHAAGWPLNQQATPLSQFLVSMSRINKELEAYESVDDADRHTFISDRTPLDSIAYTMVQMQDYWDGGNSHSMQYYLKIARELAVRHTRQYDKVVFVEPLPIIADDGVRPLDTVYRNKVNAYMKYLCVDNDIPIYRLPAMAPEARLDALTKYVFGVV